MKFFDRIYQDLCENRKENSGKYGPGSGLHRHHIHPTHSGGLNEESNYTYLTPREHVIAHFLLWKMNRNPNDLRSMKMLGVQLSVAQRRIVGKWCAENKIGFYGAEKGKRSEWAKRGVRTQRERKIGIFDPSKDREYRSNAGKISFKSPKSVFAHWASPEGRKKRAEMGAKAHAGKRCMYRPGDTSFKRIKPEDIQRRLDEGYVFGSPLDCRKGKGVLRVSSFGIGS